MPPLQLGRTMFEVIDKASEKIGNIVMTICAYAVLVTMAAIVLQVMASRFGITTILNLPGDWMLFGSAITLNSLTDFQWHMLSFIALIPSGIVLLRGEHVRVDFAYGNFGTRGKAVVDLIGHVMFALPFILVVVPDAVDIAATAFERGEKSANGGLVDRFLVRAVLPVGLMLLLTAIAFETWEILKKWKAPEHGT